MKQFLTQLFPQGESPIDAFTDSIREMIQSLMKTMPYVVIWLVNILLAVFIFKLLRKGIVSLLDKIGADRISEKVGLTKMLQGFGIKDTLSSIVGKIAFWMLMLQFIMISSESFNLQFLTEPLNGLISLLPKAISALIIFVIGALFCDFIRNAIHKGAERMGLDYSKALSNLVYGLLFVMVTILAIRQLGIETSLLEDAVKVGLVGIALALSLTLGLGLHTLARNVVSGVYARDLFQTGSTLRYNGEDAQVLGVGSVTTKLQKNDGSFVMIPNKMMVSEVMEGRDRS